MSTKTRELKREDFFLCEECNKEISDLFLYTDNYNNQTICEDCFNNRFAKNKANKNIEWFKKNYNKEDYPATFWKQFDK